MSRMMRLVVLATSLLSLSAMFAASSGAVTWDTNGLATFHATGGLTTLGVIPTNPPHQTLTLLSCLPSTQNITVTPTGPGAVFTVLRGTTTFTCSAAGVNHTFDCGFAVTASSWTAGSPAVTNGTIDLTCRQYTSGGGFECDFSGSTGAQYSNPAGTTSGRLTVAFFTTPDRPCITDAQYTLSEQTWTVTGSGTGPFVTRTS